MSRTLISFIASIAICWFLLDLSQSFGQVSGIVAFTLGYVIGKFVNEKLLPWLGFEEM